MDIREDLDDAGKVIKSDVNPAVGGSAQPFNVQAAIESFQPLVDTLAKKQKEKTDTQKPKGSVKPPPSSSSSSPKPASKAPATQLAKKVPTKEQIQQKAKPTPKSPARTPKRIQSTEKEYSSQSGMVLTEKRVKPALVPDVKETPPTPTTDDALSIKEIISAPSEHIPSTKDGQSKPTAQKEGMARIRILDDDDDDDDESDGSDDPFENLPEVEETEEERQMREEMVRYNMKEVNDIVAEIDLEEQDMSDDYDDEEDEDEDDEGTDEDDEDDDQWGRSKGQLVSNKIRREMMKLQKNIEAREKAQQVAAEVSNPQVTDSAAKVDATKPKLEEKPSESVKEKKKASEKKGVRFAEELDIAPAPAPIIKPPSNPSDLVRDGFDNEDIDPSILDMVFGPGTKDQEERYFHNTTEEPTKKKLPSLFKAARQVQKVKEQIDAEKSNPTKTTPNSSQPKKQAPAAPGSYDIIERNVVSTNAPIAPKPTGKMPVRKAKKPEPEPVLDPLGDELSDEDRPIMASSIIERAPTWEKPSDPVASKARAPKAPDELDPDFHQQEVTNAYFAMRNKLIQRQGGYVESEEEKTIVPIDENMDKKKVSRFKAGRVKSQLP
ncbi:hypothetical protein TWF694_010247 [Orbilia ellipsospora]